MRCPSDELCDQYNIAACDKTVARLLIERGYSLQATKKTVEGKQHPDRNAQFEFINAKAKTVSKRARRSSRSTPTADSRILSPVLGQPDARWHPRQVWLIPWCANELSELRGTPNTLACEVATDGVLVHERCRADREVPPHGERGSRRHAIDGAVGRGAERAARAETCRAAPQTRGRRPSRSRASPWLRHA